MLAAWSPGLGCRSWRFAALHPVPPLARAGCWRSFRYCSWLVLLHDQALARFLELSPAVLRHAHRQLERSRRAGEYCVANLLHPGAAVLLQRLFNDAIQTAQLTAAAAQHDVIQHPLLKFRVKASD